MLAHLRHLGHVDAMYGGDVAEVRLDITMCSAILMRMVLMGSMRVWGCPPGPAAGGGGGG